VVLKDESGMSSNINVSEIDKSEKPPLPWSLWLRQIRAIFRLEIEKNFLGRRSILLYLLALIPILPLALLAPFTPPGREWQDFTQYSMIFAVYYGGLILRTVVFFGCAWIFMNLFRGDIVDRSLHFYFLSPGGNQYQDGYYDQTGHGNPGRCRLGYDRKWSFGHRNRRERVEIVDDANLF
jgi:hypothetical protein